MANKITSIFDFKSSGLSKVKQDIAGVDGAWNKARTGFKSAITEFKSSTAAQAAVIGGLAVAANRAINDASDLEESVNAVTVTYGENAEAVLAIGENAAQSFGMSKTAFNSFAVSFSSFAKQVAEQDGRDVSVVLEEITTRVADVASVLNLDLNTAAQLFQSTMAGSSEVARQYGYDVSAATVEQRLLNDGLVESKSAITEADKVLGRYLVLMDETSTTAGDFANTSDSLANSQRTVNAQLTDISARLGQELTPAVADAVAMFSDLLAVADDLKVIDLATEFGKWHQALQNPYVGVKRMGEATTKTLFSLENFEGTVEVLEASLRRLGASEEEIAAAVLYYKQTADDGTAATKDATDAHDDHMRALQGDTAATDAAAEASRFLNRDIIIANRSLEDHTETVSAAADAVDRLKREFDDGRQALDELTRSLEAEQGMQRLIDQLQQASEEGGFTAQEIRDLKLEVINYGDKVGGLPPSVTTDIVALIDEGAYLEALRKLDVFTQARIAPVVSIINPQTGSQYDGPRAHGGPTQAGKFYKVNENGSELLTEGGTTYLMAGSNGKVTPLDKAGSVGVGGGNTYNITVQTLAVTADTKRVLAEAVADIERDRKGML